MPGVGGHYHHIAGNPTVLYPAPEPGMVPQTSFYNQTTSAPYFPENQIQTHIPAAVQELPSQPTFQSSQAPISPPYSQTNQGQASNPPSTQSQISSANLHQFGGPLFDPSDPALFNFDISSLNFGNHYGALEMGMLGHMSSGVAETPPGDCGALGGAIGRRPIIGFFGKQDDKTHRICALSLSSLLFSLLTHPLFFTSSPPHLHHHIHQLIPFHHKVTCYPPSTHPGGDLQLCNSAQFTLHSTLEPCAHQTINPTRPAEPYTTVPVIPTSTKYTILFSLSVFYYNLLPPLLPTL